MDTQDERTFDNLCLWMSSLANSNIVASVEELCTGRPIANALKNLDSEYFNEAWFKRTFENESDSNANWRLKVLALKKILKSIIDYYLSATQRFLPESAQPDVQIIARDMDKHEIVKLLQLVVVVAINCPARTNIISNISNYDENVQSSIMMAIQEVEGDRREPEHLSDVALAQIHSFQEELKHLQEQIIALSQSNEDYEKKCLDLETHLVQLQDEKRTLNDEKSHLENLVKTRCYGSDDNENFTKKMSIMQKRLDDAEEELFKAEHSRDEYMVKIENLTRESKDLYSKFETNGTSRDDFLKMKDELEELRLKMVEFKKMEATLETYKRKLDESSQLRNELKAMQDKNSLFMNCAIELEEEKRRNSALKTQFEAYKWQLDECKVKMGDYGQELEVVKKENERLKSDLKQYASERKRATTELNSMKDLKHEMQLLEKGDKDQVIDSLESRLQTKDLELMTTEEKFKTALHAKDMELRLIDERYKALQSSKDNDVRLLEEKYQVYLAKAKTVIVELEQSSQSSPNSGVLGGKVEFETLRKDIEDKEKIISKLQEDQERMRIMREQEDRLMTTAFHEMAMKMHRDASEKRLLIQTGQTPLSFLARQRQITTSVVNNNNDKNGNLNVVNSGSMEVPQKQQRSIIGFKR